MGWISGVCTANEPGHARRRLQQLRPETREIPSGDLSRFAKHVDAHDNRARSAEDRTYQVVHRLIVSALDVGVLVIPDLVGNHHGYCEFPAVSVMSIEAAQCRIEFDVEILLAAQREAARPYRRQHSKLARSTP